MTRCIVCGREITTNGHYFGEMPTKYWARVMYELNADNSLTRVIDENQPKYLRFLLKSRFFEDILYFFEQAVFQERIRPTIPYWECDECYKADICPVCNGSDFERTAKWDYETLVCQNCGHKIHKPITQVL